MTPVKFYTQEGIKVPAVTSEEMREIDRVAMEEFGLGMQQMMENAGRNLAENTHNMLGDADGEIVILAGAGGNGGGGLCCARHLHNHGFKTIVVLDRAPDQLKGAATLQLHILATAGVHLLHPSEVNAACTRPLSHAGAARSQAKVSAVPQLLMG